MSIGRRLVGDTLIFGFAMVAARGVSLILLPMYTRFLGTAEYGAFDLLMSLNRALFIPASLGMDSGLAIAWRGTDAAEQRRVSASCLVVQLLWLTLLIAALGAVAAPIASWLFGDSGRTGAVEVVLLLLAAQVLANFLANLAKWQREAWRFLVLLLGTAMAAGTGSAIMVAGLHRGAAGAVTGLAAGTALFLPIGFVLVLRHLSPSVSLRIMARCVALGVPFAVNGAAELVFPFVLRLIMLDSGGLASVGVFAAANTVGMVAILIAYAFSSAWWPFALSDEGRRTQGEWPRLLRLLAFLQLIPVAGLALLAAPIASVVLGGGAYAAAGNLIAPIAFAYWIKSVRQEAAVGFTAAGKSWAYSAFGGAAIAASLLFAWLLTPRFGLPGTALGMVAGETCAFAAQLVYARRTGHAITMVRPTFTMGLAFIALAAAIALTPPMPLAGDIVARMVVAVAFLVVLTVFRAVPLRDIRHASRLLRDTFRPR